MAFKRTAEQQGSKTDYSTYGTDRCNRSRAEAIQEVERECNVRMRCFDKWVADGRLGDVEATDRLERLISAWHYLCDTDEARKALCVHEANK